MLKNGKKRWEGCLDELKEPSSCSTWGHDFGNGVIDKASGHRVGREEVGGGREGGREEGRVGKLGVG